LPSSVCKLHTAMLKRLAGSTEYRRGRMPRPRNVIAGLATLMVAGLMFLAAPLAQQAPATPNPDDPNFDFSIYYTGNVRGNLEPCG
jgi:hypothetical protein